MGLMDRTIVVSILCGLSAAGLALIDFFVVPVNIEGAYSPIVFGLLLLVFWIAAPRIGKYIKVR